MQNPYIHLEANDARVVIDTDNINHTTIVVYGKDGNILLHTSIAPLNIVTNIYGKWDIMV